jgi:hypothetical protein
LGPPSRQLSLWDWNPKEAAKQERLQEALSTLKQRYGSDAIRADAAIKPRQHD